MLDFKFHTLICLLTKIKTIMFKIWNKFCKSFLKCVLQNKNFNLILFNFFAERGNPLKRFVQITVTRTTYNQDIKMESSKFSRNMSASRQNVHLLLVACSVFMFLMLSSMLPQTRAVLSGTGGVFDSPAAQEYWARRYV